MEPGEFAVRGGLVDLFPPGTAEPLRLDLFGDTLEAIRSFDPMSQRSTGDARRGRAAAGQRGAADAGQHRALPRRLSRAVRQCRGRRRALRGGVGRPAPCRHGALAAAVPRAPRDAARLLPRGDRHGRPPDRRGLRGAPRADRRLLRRPPEDRRQGRHERRRRLQAGAARAALPQAVGMGPAARRPQRRPVHQLRRRARRAQHDRSRRPPPRRLRPGAHGAGREPVRQGGRAREGRQRRRPPGRDRGLHRRLGGAPAASPAGAWRHDAGPGARLRDRAAACRRARSASRCGRSSTASCSTASRSSARRTS